MKGYRSSSESRDINLFSSYCSANYLVMQETVKMQQFVYSS